jgi:hypothetical protein
MGYNHMGYNHSCFQPSFLEKGPSTIGRFPSWDGTILVKKPSRSDNENVVKKPTACLNSEKSMLFLLILKNILVHSFRRHKLGFSENPKKRRGKTDSPHPKKHRIVQIQRLAREPDIQPVGLLPAYPLGFFDQQVSD